MYNGNRIAGDGEAAKRHMRAIADRLYDLGHHFDFAGHDGRFPLR